MLDPIPEPIQLVANPVPVPETLLMQGSDASNSAEKVSPTLSPISVSSINGEGQFSQVERINWVATVKTLAAAMARGIRRNLGRAQWQSSLKVYSQMRRSRETMGKQSVEIPPVPREFLSPAELGSLALHRPSYFSTSSIPSLWWQWHYVSRIGCS